VFLLCRRFLSIVKVAIYGGLCGSLDSIYKSFYNLTLEFRPVIFGIIISQIEHAAQLIRNNQLQQAELLLRTILKKNPNHPQAVFLLAQAAISGGAYSHAERFLKQYLLINPKAKDAQLQLAQVSAEIQATSRAEKYYQRLVADNPEWTTGLFSYAGFLQSIGELDLAKQQLEKVIANDPYHSGAYLALTGLIRYSADNPLITKMENALDLANNNNQPKQQMQLHYALGKVYDDIGACSKAFQHWRLANQIQLKESQFRVEQMKPFLKQLKSNFKDLPNEFMKQENSLGSEQSKVTPVFIVGLPRSGSTLLEQILCQYSQIESVGETNRVSRIIATGIAKVTQKPFPKELQSVTNQQWLALGKDYLNEVSNEKPDANFIIDKLPANFQSIGLIKKALPNAVVIHLAREPRAVALSVFKNYFAANEPYFCDLEEFASYYELYFDMMKFWQQYFESEIIQLSYRELISNPQSEIEKVLERLGLEWKQECLDFHNTKSKVNTLSDIQIRQPLYHSSLDSWLRYQSYLVPFFKNLTD
jgi:LPS sulfotransferase NodH/thioredoxin-like negative regulator of GroEL